MRTPISVNVVPFDIESIQQKLDDVRAAFVRYLQGVSTKSGPSKHALMGPIGKIFSEIRNGRMDPASLKGYALRVQNQSGTRASLETIEALEAGITQLTDLLQEVPVSYQEKVLDRLDYGVYFDLQKSKLLRLEALRNRWHEFLRKKYDPVESLAIQWEETITSIDKVPIPKKSEGDKGDKDSIRKQDIREFWAAEIAHSEIVVDEE